jgi:hypothetical protein
MQGATPRRAAKQSTARPVSKTPVPEGSVDPRLGLMQLADELAAIRRRHVFEPAAADGPGAAPNPGLVQRLRRLLGRTPAVQPGRESTPESVQVDAALDTAWSHAHPALSDIGHVFHQEWFGIRAAAGYLPGTKLAIASARPLSVENLATLAETVQLRKLKTVLFHGWSPNALMTARAIREACGREVRLVAVWHGNTAQFMNPFELQQVSELVALRRKKVVDALASVKPDFHLVDAHFHETVLLNVGPMLREREAPAAIWDTALIPVPNDWRKNYFTNVFACSAARVRVVYVTTPLPRPFGFKVTSKVVDVGRPPRAELFSLLRQVGIMMNASLSECQPMTALEAMVHGVPCVTGPLALGALDAHPYQQLAQVAAVDTVGPVSAAVRTLLTMRRDDPRELLEMMQDYERQLHEAAWSRLAEFLP